MSSRALVYGKIVQFAAPLLAGLLVLSAAGHRAAQAETGHMLVIPASDGYGFDDCIGSNKACGQIIADAWCEAHGMTAAVSFGRTDDITASIPAKSDAGHPQHGSTLAPGSFVVNCRD